MVRRDLSVVAFQRLPGCRMDSDKKLHVRREGFVLIGFRCNLNLLELPYRSLITDQIQLQKRLIWYTKAHQQEVVRRSGLFVVVIL